MTEYAHELLNPKNWKPAKGYANGVSAQGRVLYLGGHIGWNGDQVFEAEDFLGQVDQCLANIVDVLETGGAGPEHLVRLTWYITDKQEYLANLPEMGKIYRKHLGKNFPAMAMVQVAALIEDLAKVEIEATAVVPD